MDTLTAKAVVAAAAATVGLVYSRVWAYWLPGNGRPRLFLSIPARCTNEQASHVRTAARSIGVTVTFE